VGWKIETEEGAVEEQPPIPDDAKAPGSFDDDIPF